MMESREKQTISISRKILLIFIAVLIIELFLFAISLTLATAGLTKEVTYLRLDDYLSNVQLLDDGNNDEMLKKITGKYIEEIIIHDRQEPVYGSIVLGIASEEQIKDICVEAKIYAEQNKINHGSAATAVGSIYYGYTKTNNNTIVIAVSSGAYLNNSTFNMISFVILIYAVIFAVGASIVLIWARSMMKRINRLRDFVVAMPANGYKNVYVDDGDDEISQLSIRIDDMRRTIIKDEESKEAMLQNVSHDLKTPIAVIRSYAEAIGDGIEDLDATSIIIEQCTKLEKKVKRFIEFNKLEYLAGDAKFEQIKISEIVRTIVNNCKHLTNVKIEIDLDQTTFLGKYENYYTVCENIIENSIRYAKTIIKITLKDGILSIYNDGKHIDESFIKNGFKPYEKGSEGKFGLGMSIVCRTLDYFHMCLSAENNEPVGVTFTIKAKE